MENKDQIIKNLLRSKVELKANRNERFANIQDELEDLRHRIQDHLGGILKKVADFSSKNEK